MDASVRGLRDGIAGGGECRVPHPCVALWSLPGSLLAAVMRFLDADSTLNLSCTARQCTVPAEVKRVVRAADEFLSWCAAELRAVWFISVRTWPLHLRTSRRLALVAIKRNPHALEMCPEELRADRELVLAAVAQAGYVLKYATRNVQSDRQVVLAAVANYGCALEYAAESLQADKEVVLQAVAEDGLALNYAAATLRADEEVVLEAVARTGCDLLHWAALALGDRKLARVISHLRAQSCS